MKKMLAAILIALTTASLMPAVSHAADQEIFDARVALLRSRTCAELRFDVELSGVKTRAEAYQLIKQSFAAEEFTKEQLEQLAAISADQYVACGLVKFPFSEKVLEFFGSHGRTVGSSAFSS